MTLRFGPFTLDDATRQLTRGGVELHLSTKAFDLLAKLAERRPAVVDKAELRRHLWPETHVVDASLTNLVAEIRSVLSDRESSAPVVRTVHGIGYAFAADAQHVEAGQGVTSAGPPRFWLVLKGQAMVLGHAENIIGRDPGCAVWIDADGVSRRHASIQIEGEAATLEDLASTNGTFLNGTALGRPARLKDGDRIRLGKTTLTFRAAGADTPTKRVRKTTTGHERR